MTEVLMRARARPGHEGKIESAAQSMFAAIRQEEPEGIRYTAYRSGDSFLILLELQDGIENPLPAIAAVRSFQEQLSGWLAEPPSMEQLTVVGGYRSF